MSDDTWEEIVKQLHGALTPGDLDHTLTQISAAAVEVMPEVDYASFTVRHADQTLTTEAPTAGLLIPLDVAQYELREGPCYDAATDGSHVISPDLATDDRFPRYAAVAVASGIRAQVGLRLFEGPRGDGALNLYSHQRGAFRDWGALEALFAHQACVAIAYAREIDDLQQAVRTRKAIGQAIGILMERYGLTDQRAFAFLSRLSQHRNVKLRIVAQELVDEAEARGAEAAR